ncbi:MAG: coenzyme F420-0:L-glutamate ligase [Bifidobacteriaceae bacterium]|nr:coenzyme F420-0:L-glutamate ligase [Bifidobacteriaceae bacterium]
MSDCGLPLGTVQVLPVRGVPQVKPGDNLAGLLAAALKPWAREGDVLVVSSKVVSKAEGRVFPAEERDALIDAETVRTVATREGPAGRLRIVENRQGFVMASAGVDLSNTDPGTALALPVDPDRSARELRAGLKALTGLKLAVVIADTSGRPWRRGVTDVAIGAAGLEPLLDLRGQPDAGGRLLTSTSVAVADELAAASELVRAKAGNVAAALIRGLPGVVTDADGPGAAALRMPPELDLFRQGAAPADNSAPRQP